MFYTESGDLLEGLLGWIPGSGPALEALDPKTEMGTKTVLDCGGGNFVTYPKGTIDPYTAQVCGCDGTIKGGKVYGLDGLWPCPPSLGGTGNSWFTDHPAPPVLGQPPTAAQNDWAAKGWVRPPSSSPHHAMGAWHCPATGAFLFPEHGDAIPYACEEEIAGPKKGPAASKPPGAPKPPLVSYAGAPRAPAVPWWVWALVAAGGAWFLLRKRGA